MENHRSICVGRGSKTQSDGTEWPYDIWISFRDKRYPISVGEGVGHASMGCGFAAEELLQPQWAEHVKICQCEWLVEAIRGLKDNGKTITPQVLEAIWKAR